MRLLIYIGTVLIIAGMIWSLVNYVFHTPAYRPEWFDMQTMIRLIEMNLIFTAAGTVLIIYAILRSGSSRE